MTIHINSSVFLVGAVVKIFAVGNPGAGKSTLTRSISQESRGMDRVLNRFSKVSGVDEKTAGIIPHDLSSKRIGGNVTIYDFAGHREFYASHDAIVQNAITTSSSYILMLVANLSKSDEEFKLALQYWLCFLENQIECSSASSKPHLVVVASHCDEVKKPEMQRKIEFVNNMHRAGSFSRFNFTRIVPLDCTFSESHNMTELRKLLCNACQEIRLTSEFPLSRKESFLFNTFFQSNAFESAPAVTIEMIESKLRDPLVVRKVAEVMRNDSDKLAEAISLPWDTMTVASVCKNLNERGHILFIENQEFVKNSWAILDKSSLLHIAGTIFAPEGFKEHTKAATATGLVSFSKLVSLVPDLNADMIAQFLTHLGFCNQISDPQTISLLQGDPSTTEKIFFFPELVSLEVPKDAWKENTKFCYHTGWIGKSCVEGKFFMPRYVQVLLLRLAFSFAFKSTAISEISSLLRNCLVWKNGITWTSLDGVEALVEVVNQTMVLVMLRSYKGYETNLLQLRSQIIKMVFQVRDEFCPVVHMQDYVLSPEHALQYPPSYDALQLVSISGIATSIKQNKEFAFNEKRDLEKLDELLFFEPYMGMSETILKELFDEECPASHEQMNDAFLYDIAKPVSTNVKHYVSLFKPDPSSLDFAVERAPQGDSHKLVRVFQLWRDLDREGSRYNFRKKLDKFSIFAGRNPLKL